MGEPDSADLKFLNENFTRYGQAWQGGLAMLEESYELEIVKKWRTFEILLRSRSLDLLGFVITIRRKDGRMSTSHPELPEGRELSPAEMNRVDEVLAEIGELWLNGPLNGRIWCLPLDGGLEQLRADPNLRDGQWGGDETDVKPLKVQTRWLDGRALICLSDAKWGQDMFCLVLDLEQASVLDASFIDLPAREGGLLSPERFQFFDQSLKTHGDFGVYGNLTPGLRWLVENMELSIREGEEYFECSANPRDGHGHYFHFAVEKDSGKIEGVACGHLVPRPSIRDE